MGGYATPCVGPVCTVALQELDQYYAIISKATDREFDIRAAAALELEWWKERRRSIAPQDYARTIARATALVYGVPEEKVLPAARMRAEAMAYRDARRDGKMTDADWQEIARQLLLAYASLKEAVSTGRTKAREHLVRRALPPRLASCF